MQVGGVRRARTDVVLLLLGVALTTLLTGCATTHSLSSAARASIYQRAAVEFDKTVLVKPEESARPEFRMAPLLVEAMTSMNDVPHPPYAVYFWRTHALLDSQVLEQFNYLWFQDDQESEAKNPQGVRITFDPTGKPIVWEVLRDKSGAKLLFVSQSLEAAAMTNYPAPLPGRRFWIERGVTNTPDIVVARIIDDSPTPMGPIVYLTAGSHDVSTLICRCMDAQAKEVVGTGIYGLATLDEAAVRWVSKDKTPGIARWLPGKPADELQKWLRVKFQ